MQHTLCEHCMPNIVHTIAHATLSACNLLSPSNFIHEHVVALAGLLALHPYLTHTVLQHVELRRMAIALVFWVQGKERMVQGLEGVDSHLPHSSCEHMEF